MSTTFDFDSGDFLKTVAAATGLLLTAARSEGAAKPPSAPADQPPSSDEIRRVADEISRIIDGPSYIAVDSADVQAVLGFGGKVTSTLAYASGPDRARRAAEEVCNENTDLANAKGVLVIVSAAKGSLKLFEAKMAMNMIRDGASENATIIYGTTFDDALEDAVRITIVATGLPDSGMPSKNLAPICVRAM